jgi:hypothetical protein
MRRPSGARKDSTCKLRSRNMRRPNYSQWNTFPAAGFAVGRGLQGRWLKEELMKFRSLIGILGSAVLVVGCAQSDSGITTSVKTQLAETPGPTPFGEAVSDAGITARVKTMLLDDPGVSGLRIDVDTRDGIVALTGIVNSAAEKSRALEHAAKVDNVTRVEDRLMVRPR